MAKEKELRDSKEQTLNRKETGKKELKAGRMLMIVSLFLILCGYIWVIAGQELGWFVLLSGVFLFMASEKQMAEAKDQISGKKKKIKEK